MKPSSILARAATAVAVLLLTWAYILFIVPQDGIIDPRETILTLIGVITAITVIIPVVTQCARTLTTAITRRWRHDTPNTDDE